MATVLSFFFVFLSHIKFSSLVKEAVLGSGEMACSSFRPCRGLKPWPLRLQRTWFLQTTDLVLFKIFFFLLELGRSPCNFTAVDRMCLFCFFSSDDLLFVCCRCILCFPWPCWDRRVLGKPKTANQRRGQCELFTTGKQGSGCQDKACMGGPRAREFLKRACPGGGWLFSPVHSHQDQLIYKGSFLWGSRDKALVKHRCTESSRGIRGKWQMGKTGSSAQGLVSWGV